MPEFLAQLLPRLARDGRGSFSLSLALHVAAAALLCVFPGGDRAGPRPEKQRPREFVRLTAPPPELYRSPPPPEPQAPQPAPSRVRRPAAPRPEPAPLATVEQQRVPPQRVRLEIEPLQAPRARAAAAAPIDTPRLNERGPAEGLLANLGPRPEITKPRLVVKEAGFAGVAPEREGRSAPARLTTGLFGSAGAPSGSGRDRPAGKIAAAGFGKVALAENRVEPSRSVRSGGFSRAAVKKPAAKREAAAPKPSSTQPVRVLSKPTPAYTEEARALRIEGETTLEALFRADGTVEVLRVVRGLGHGLDENAVAAAREIRFEPARRDGKPVDAVVQLHIRFEMAY